MLNQQYLKAVYMSCRLTGKAHSNSIGSNGNGETNYYNRCTSRLQRNCKGWNKWLYCKVKSSQALVKAMFSFIEQPELIESMGNNSRKIAEDKHDVDKVNKHMMLEMGFKI